MRSVGRVLINKCIYSGCKLFVCCRQLKRWKSLQNSENELERFLLSSEDTTWCNISWNDILKHWIQCQSYSGLEANIYIGFILNLFEWIHAQSKDNYMWFLKLLDLNYLSSLKDGLTTSLFRRYLLSYLFLYKHIIWRSYASLAKKLLH